VVRFVADLTAAVAASDQYCGRAERSRAALAYGAVERCASTRCLGTSFAHHLATITCLPYAGLWPMLF
jgi:hypothetical protein